MIVLQMGREGLLLLTTISSNRPNSKVLNLQIKRKKDFISVSMYLERITNSEQYLMSSTGGESAFYLVIRAKVNG